MRLLFGIRVFGRVGPGAVRVVVMPHDESRETATGKG